MNTGRRRCRRALYRRHRSSSRMKCSAVRVCCVSARSIIAVCGASLPRKCSSPSEMKKAVFLDRDGTLNVDVGYLHRLEDLELFPWTADALRLLKRAGFTLIVVTNQSGVAHGLIDPVFPKICHDKMRRRLQQGAADLDGFYSCNHH